MTCFLVVLDSRVVLCRLVDLAVAWFSATHVQPLST